MAEHVVGTSPSARHLENESPTAPCVVSCRFETEAIKRAETNEAASANSATGAVSRDTRPPPALGPAACAMTREVSNLAFRPR
jgi:hypothetical protein